MHHAELKHILDIIGAILDFLATLYFIRASMLAWPLSFFAISANTSLYFFSGLYGDTVLQSIYLISTLYGWYEWKFGGKNKRELSVSFIKKYHAITLLLTTVISIFLVHFILLHYTNSNVPWQDAITTVLSLCAQWLMCRKIVECWAVWFVVDVLYVFLYFNKGMPFHSGLLVIYVFMAVAGYWRWRSLERRKSKPIHAG